MTKLSKLLPQTSEPELILHEPIELVADLKKRDIFCKFGLIELARCVICQTLFDILNPVRLAFVTLLRMDVLVQAFLPYSKHLQTQIGTSTFDHKSVHVEPSDGR